jgi:tetratricopeptide (TPR) repeat protein
MKLKFKHTTTIFVVCLVINSLNLRGQDTTFKLNIDTFNFAPLFQFTRYYPEFNFIDHSPAKEDFELFKKSRTLISQQPTIKNHEKYFRLACSLWELKKTSEAEKMFLAIVNSNKKFYTATYYSSSDIPGDTTQNSYGYGSFTYNYKNNACIFLTKIYLEDKQFARALQCLNDAIKKYKEVYTCGTGYEAQQDKYRFLYAACYTGLNRNKEIVNLLLPYCLDWDDKIMIGAIKKLYTKTAISRYLAEAEKSITCVVDSFQSFTVSTSNYGEKDEKSDTIRYYSGTGTIKLFEKRIKMPTPDLQEGEIVTKEYFRKIYHESPFYLSLHQDKEMAKSRPAGLSYLER